MFQNWLLAEWIDLRHFRPLPGQHANVDMINIVLIRYGRGLYQACRPYSNCAETVNALCGKLPKVRSVLQPAWDIASHMCITTWQIFLALLAFCVCWGWTTPAGILVPASWSGACLSSCTSRSTEDRMSSSSSSFLAKDACDICVLVYYLNLAESRGEVLVHCLCFFSFGAYNALRVPDLWCFAWARWL